MRYRNKLQSTFFGLLYLLPFIIIGIIAITYIGDKSAEIPSVTALLQQVTESLPKGTVYECLYTLFGEFGATGVYVNFTCATMGMYLYVMIMHIAVDIILVLPTICRQLFDRITGYKDKD